ncbi:hypothetical protein KIPB_012277 [Kipferlia bialata]|uniref:Uncharacterized protein n=1 Tax=Kipferlia bialata TaxID=797122 RepID=A0A9K3GNS6_9EUKA|nr:hypothetical protein KIPB_012277 [Kipferlia bialata]|eukprot:g12277.t1
MSEIEEAIGMIDWVDVERECTSPQDFYLYLEKRGERLRQEGRGFSADSRGVYLVRVDFSGLRREMVKYTVLAKLMLTNPTAVCLNYLMKGTGQDMALLVLGENFYVAGIV